MEGGKIVINERLLSIPPRLSVSWREVSSLYQKHESLHIVLKGGEQIVVENLDSDLLDTIFHHHALFLEKRAEERHHEMLGPAGLAKWSPPFPEGGGEALMKIGLPFPPLDAMGMMVEHNPAQKDAPLLPPELLEKVSGVIRLLTDDPEGLPKPEGSCNCFHCQIARALHPASEKFEPVEEVISIDDLTFSDWEVEDAGEKLFKVKSKLDPKEAYSVFLGSPVGCTCGRANCEHVVAALKS